MVQVSALQILGLILFLVIGGSLIALQLERFDKYRHVIFGACVLSFIGTGVIGYITYVASEIHEYELLDDKKEGGGGKKGGSGSGGGGGGGGGGSGGGGGAGGGGGGGSGGADGEEGAEDAAEGETGEGDDKEESRAEADIYQDCDVCPRMVRIPPGEAILGRPSRSDAPKEEKPEAGVAFEKAFSVSMHEISRKQFEIYAKDTGFSGSGPCETDGIGGKNADFRSPGFDQEDNHPVVCVSHADAERYTEWLTEKAGVSYRLLYESEWEYARRGAASLADAQAELDIEPESGNIKGDDWLASTSGGGEFNANTFRLHDMMGNAAEWTADCWRPRNIDVPADGSMRPVTERCERFAVRGGSWDSTAKRSTPTARRGVVAETRDWRIGFRVMRLGGERPSDTAE
ncbi:MAG: formylglycine-generating enzyme family protein [Pseudomonadota bacterium]